MANLTQGSTTGALSPHLSKAPFTVTRRVNTATTNLAVGAHQIINIPADYLVLDASVKVEVVDAGGGTIALGDTGNAARYAAATATSAVVYTAPTVVVRRTPTVTASTVDITVATATLTTAVLLVTALCLDLRKGS